MLNTMVKNKVAIISRKQYTARLAFERVTNILFPFDIVAGRENLAVVDQHLVDGYMLITLNNHFSMRDSIQMIQVLLSLKEARDRVAGLPLATHQHNKISNFVYSNMNIETYPVLTPKGLKDQLRMIRALDIPKSDKVILKKLLMEQLGMYKEQFIASAVHLLTHGGVLGSAPEAHRCSRFSKFPGETLTDIASVLQKIGVDLDKVLIWLVGIGVKGVDDYSEVSGFNVRKQNQIAISEPVSISTLRKQMTELPGEISSLDYFCYLWMADLLKSVASDDYLADVGESCLEVLSNKG